LSGFSAAGTSVVLLERAVPFRSLWFRSRLPGLSVALLGCSLLLLLPPPPPPPPPLLLLPAVAIDPDEVDSVGVVD
jgi:hypothetical protein